MWARKALRPPSPHASWSATTDQPRAGLFEPAPGTARRVTGDYGLDRGRGDGRPLGLEAAADADVSLSRLIVVPDVRGQAAEAVAALLDGMSYVIVGSDAGLSLSNRRQLLARACDRRCGLVATNGWVHSSLRLRAAHWSGTEEAAGYFRHCTFGVERQRRGVTDAWTLTLPKPAQGPLDPARPGTAVQHWRARLRAMS